MKDIHFLLQKIGTPGLLVNKYLLVGRVHKIQIEKSCYRKNVWYLRIVPLQKLLLFVNTRSTKRKQNLE